MKDPRPEEELVEIRAGDGVPPAEAAHRARRLPIGVRQPVTGQVLEVVQAGLHAQASDARPVPEDVDRRRAFVGAGKPSRGDEGLIRGARQERGQRRVEAKAQLALLQQPQVRGSGDGCRQDDRRQQPKRAAALVCDDEPAAGRCRDRGHRAVLGERALEVPRPQVRRGRQSDLVPVADEGVADPDIAGRPDLQHIESVKRDVLVVADAEARGTEVLCGGAHLRGIGAGSGRRSAQRQNRNGNPAQPKLPCPHPCTVAAQPPGVHRKAAQRARAGRRWPLLARLPSPPRDRDRRPRLPYPGTSRPRSPAAGPSLPQEAIRTGVPTGTRR